LPREKEKIDLEEEEKKKREKLYFIGSIDDETVKMFEIPKRDEVMINNIS
jgi:hypothetical protein